MFLTVVHFYLFLFILIVILFRLSLSNEFSAEKPAGQHIWWLFRFTIINSELLPHFKDCGRVARHIFTTTSFSLCHFLFPLPHTHTLICTCPLFPFLYLLSSFFASFYLILHPSIHFDAILYFFFFH